MSSLTTLARPYAKAAFELAQGEQSLAAWDGMLSLACDIVTEESMAALLENPDVSREQVLGIITGAAGDAFSERFRGFLSVLSENGRLPLLPQVVDIFRALRELGEQVHRHFHPAVADSDQGFLLSASAEVSTRKSGPP